MNEKETSAAETEQQGAEQPVSESAPEQQPVNELTPEEKLAERERLLAERERAFEMTERRAKAAKLLEDRQLPSELSDFVNMESDEKTAESIQRLGDILGKYTKGNVDALPRISTGMEHGKPVGSDMNDSFITGFNG